MSKRSGVWPPPQWWLHRFRCGWEAPGLAHPPALPALGPRGVRTGQADTSASCLGRSPSHTCARKPPALGSRAVSALSPRKARPCARRCRGVHVPPCSSGEAQHPLVVRGPLPQRGRSCAPFSPALPSHCGPSLPQKAICKLPPQMRVCVCCHFLMVEGCSMERLKACCVGKCGGISVQ